MRWAELFRYTATMGGPVHVHAAAVVCGLQPATIRARARREGWWHPYRDVVAPPGVAGTARDWALAGLARLRGPDPHAPRSCALTGWSAAAAYGVRARWPARTEVLVPHARGALAVERRLRLRRTRDLDAPDLALVDGVAVVSGARLVQDLAATTAPEALVPVAIDLCQRRITSIEELAYHHDRRGRYPARARVETVLARLGAAGRTDSAPELLLREHLLAVGVPLDVGQVRVACRDGRHLHLDLGIARIRFGIEVQSMLAHAQRSDLLRDVRRRNALAQLPEDWRVLHASYEDVAEPGRLAGAVAEVVAAQSRRHLGLPWPVSAPPASAAPSTGRGTGGPSS